jgi:hypothetical protein
MHSFVVYWTNSQSIRRGDDVKDEEQILAIEESGYAAIESGDAALLREILAPSFKATTAEGKVVDCDEWISLVTSAAVHGIHLRPHAATVTVSDGLAVVHREVTVLAETGPAPQPRRISYVTVYERRDGKWYVTLNSSRSA